MPLFVCDKCDTIENAALCRYWSRRNSTDGKALCSTCDPKTAKWHGRFPQRVATEEVVRAEPADYFHYAGRFEPIRVQRWEEEYHCKPKEW